MNLRLFFCILILLFCVGAASAWDTKFDGRVEFYQTTDFGVLLVGTENSLYGVDGRTGETIWRRDDGGLDESSIVPVPGTDLVLLSLDAGKKSRIAALDLLSGAELWRSDKVKGSVIQLAVEPNQNLLCAVLVKNARGKTGETVKREPMIAVFDLQNGDLLWKRDLGGDVELMPANFDDGETSFTLDNYRAPLILDERVFLFYNGATSFDARTGTEREREKFKINEANLALTEADPVFDNDFVYTSGRGRIRAVRRGNGQVEWEAKDLGVTPEIVVGDKVLYARTGGQFTNIKTGEIENKGQFGVSAIDKATGKTLWRFKGADKGLTNFVFADADTILLADKDDLIALDANNGKRKYKFAHKIKDAQFIIINENRQAVIGGSEELAAFQSVSSSKFQVSSSIENAAFSDGQRTKDKGQNAIWRVKHDAPKRSILRRVGSIGLRATALYFRYGGAVSFGFNALRGASLAGSVLSLRWSGLQNRIGNFDLTALAANSAQNRISAQYKTYGIASGRQSNVNARGGESNGLLDRLDPANAANRVANWLSRRQRLAALRENFMYFYTDLPSGGKGFVGVNVNNGATQREIRLNEPDARFVTDEVAGLLYSANGNRLTAYSLSER